MRNTLLLMSALLISGTSLCLAADAANPAAPTPAAATPAAAIPAVVEREPLENKAANGDKGAQMNLNTAAHDGKLGFNAATGIAYLKERVSKGDENAKEWLDSM